MSGTKKAIDLSPEFLETFLTTIHDISCLIEIINNEIAYKQIRTK